MMRGAWVGEPPIGQMQAQMDRYRSAAPGAAGEFLSRLDREFGGDTLDDLECNVFRHCSGIESRERRIVPQRAARPAGSLGPGIARDARISSCSID